MPLEKISASNLAARSTANKSNELISILKHVFNWISAAATAFGLSSILLLSDKAEAQNLYKCLDREGKVTFTDRSCPGTSRQSQEQKSQTSIPVSPDLRAESAPAELVTAYNLCVKALKLRALELYANCLSRRRAEPLRQRGEYWSSMVQAMADVAPLQTKFVDGKLNRAAGVATLRLTGEKDGAPSYGIMDFIWEDGAWKVDKQSWGNIGFDQMIAREQARSKANEKDHEKTCAEALNEPPNARSTWIDVHPSEKLVARLNMAPNSTKSFEYSSSSDLVVMFRPNATERMRCKYGKDYPIAMCRDSKTCISSWYAGLKFPSVNGRVQGMIKNSGSDAIDVVVVVGPQ